MRALHRAGLRARVAPEESGGTQAGTVPWYSSTSMEMRSASQRSRIPYKSAALPPGTAAGRVKDKEEMHVEAAKVGL